MKPMGTAEGQSQERFTARAWFEGPGLDGSGASGLMSVGTLINYGVGPQLLPSIVVLGADAVPAMRVFRFQGLSALLSL